MKYVKRCMKVMRSGCRVFDAANKAERTAATRALLIGAARKFVADKGFACFYQAIVARAGVTRGALYHQFE